MTKRPEIFWPFLFPIITVLKTAGLWWFLQGNPDFPAAGDASDYIRLSELIAQSDPNWYTEDYLIRAPGYPIFLAGLRLLGLSQVFHFVAANFVLAFFLAVILFDIGRRVSGFWIGGLAGLAVSLDPTLFYYQSMVLTETLFAFLVAVIAWLLVVPLASQKATWRTIVMVGAVLG